MKRKPGETQAGQNNHKIDSESEAEVQRGAFQSGIDIAAFVLLVALPALVAIIALIIGIFTLNIRYLVDALVIGTCTALMWVVTFGIRGTSNKK
jgi:hypothetical protein